MIVSSIKKTIASVSFFLLGLGNLQAQESPVATGGEATGIGGTISYSVGQIVYTTNTGTNGSVAQGVQQPYEISTTVGVNESTITLGLSVYPNPTANYLTLKVEDSTGLHYELYNSQGKLIKIDKVNSNSTFIDIESYPRAIYFLNVTKNNELLKTFKIIKT